MAKCGSKNIIPKRNVFKKDWTLCLNYNKLDSQMRVGGPMWPLNNKHKKFHFDNASCTHMNYENHDLSGITLKLDLLAISH